MEVPRRGVIDESLAHFFFQVLHVVNFIIVFITAYITIASSYRVENNIQCLPEISVTK